jgi:putative NADH-flavin reductase
MIGSRVASEAVASAMGPSRTGGVPQDFLDSNDTLIETIGGTRFVVVGGACSLVVDGQRLVDSPGFPAIYKTESLTVAQALENAALTRPWTGPCCRRLR